jgi:flagellar hook-associated protein 2
MEMNIDGIISGLDTESIISQLMSIERMPVVNKELKQKILIKKGEIYSDIKSRLTNLRDCANDLTYESKFNVFSTSYSEESIISASASEGAVKGSYNFVINNLARAHTVGSDQQADSETALGLTGTIIINSMSVSVGSGDSLENIKNNINNTDDIGVTATIVDNVLRLKMNETGATEIALSETGDVATSLGILESGNFKNEFVAAADASFTIDGQQVLSSSNTISDLIDGVTITLLKEDSVTLNVDRDKSEIINNIREFVEQYNSTVDLIYSKVSERKIVSPETEADKLVGLVSGDMTLQNIKFKLNMLMTDVVNEIDGEINQLSFIGISKTPFAGTGVDNSDIIIGKLTIDEEALTEAIDSDIDSVMELFVKNSDIGDLTDEEYGVAVRVDNYVDSLINSVDGLITGREENFKREIDMIEDQIETYNRSLELREANLRKKFLLMEKAMASMETQSSWLQSQLLY